MSFSPPACGIHRARALFQAAVRDEFAGLPPEARQALGRSLQHLRTLATANARESQRRHKYLQEAYWRVIAVYSGHYRRLARTPAPQRSPSP